LTYHYSFGEPGGIVPIHAVSAELLFPLITPDASPLCDLFAN
jgi:hypothetical protein